MGGRRIDPVCEEKTCVYQDNGYCTVLNDTSFDGECRWYKELVKPPEKKEEEKPAPTDWVGGNKYRINRMWR